jgi:hypothetical protein
MQGVLEFVQVEPGIYRPANMPPLPEEVTSAAAGGAGGRTGATDAGPGEGTD